MATVELAGIMQRLASAGAGDVYDSDARDTIPNLIENRLGLPEYSTTEKIGTGAKIFGANACFKSVS